MPNYTTTSEDNYEFLRQMSRQTGIPMHRLIDYYIKMGDELNLLQYANREELEKIILNPDAIDEILPFLEKTKAGRKKR
jgi:hypothetical protein